MSVSRVVIIRQDYSTIKNETIEICILIDCPDQESRDCPRPVCQVEF